MNDLQDRLAQCAKLTAYTIAHYTLHMTTSALSAADLAAKSLDLPVVPVVAQKVMDEMTRVSCSAESLSAIIRGDQASWEGSFVSLTQFIGGRSPPKRLSKPSFDWDLDWSETWLSRSLLSHSLKNLVR